MGRPKMHPTISISTRDKSSVYQDGNVVLFRATEEEADEFAYQLSGELWEIELIPQKERPLRMRDTEE